jgi:CHAT domain-containing protein/tetratricopeptide (TPR) repeat protein
LTRPFDKHLDSDELDGIVSSHSVGVTDSGQFLEQALQEARHHVESCEDCRRKVQMHESVQSEISRMGVRSNVPRGSDCIEDVEWLDVAAGLLPEVKTRELMKHASQCGHCGPLLRNAAETLLDETTPNEEEVLASLSSARRDWQKNMVQTLGERTQDRRVRNERTSWWRGVRSWPRAPFAVAALIAVVVAGWLGSSVLRPPSAEQLLAQAYTERRTLEVRIPGAKYAPMRVERNTVGSNLDKSPSLLKAEALIGEKLRKNPNDPVWLQAKARADLLDGNYESAIKSLRRGLETRPDSSTLLTDLSSAYFERAEATDSVIDYGSAVEVLGKVLGKSPDDPVALFNRALICERIFLYTQAVNDWKHYLTVDPTGEWADSARRHLDALRNKLKEHQTNSSRPLLNPLEFATEGNPEKLKDVVETRLEDYMDVAVREWLPKAFPSASTYRSEQNESRVALEFLAGVALEKHQDPWLSDLLAYSSLRNFTPAVAALSQSLQANRAGDYVAAQDFAKRSEKLFDLSGNVAGSLRARVENMFAMHLSHEGEACLQNVNKLSEEIETTSYRWLQVQFRLEHAACLGVMGNYGEARRLVEAAIESARSTGYGSVYLRGLGFESDDASTIGDVRTGWARAHDGLEKFWSGIYDPMLGYNLYTDLDTAAEAQKQPYLQVAVWGEALALIASDQDLLLRAMAHSWMAKSAASAGLAELAEREFTEASRLFEAAPQNEANQSDRVEVETLLAQLEGRRGDSEHALERLRRIEPSIRLLSNHYVAIRYYGVLGGLESNQGSPGEAERALRSAVTLAEESLKSLRSDRDRSVWKEEVSESYRNLVRTKLDQGDYQNALEIWEWYKGAPLRSGRPGISAEGTPLPMQADPRFSSLDLAQGPSLPVLTEVEQSLVTIRNETIVSYGAFGDTFWIWTYDNRGIFARKSSVSSFQIESLATRFVELCSNPESDANILRQDAGRLYELLIEPIEERLSDRRTVVFEPDGTLERVPMEALLNGRGEYLLDESPIVMSPGLYFRGDTRRHGGISPRAESLVVSVPSPPAADAYGLLPLQDAESEAEMVAGELGSGRLLRGNEATLDTVMHLLPGVRVFHFTGHAISLGGAVGLVLGDTDSTNHLRLLDAKSLEGETLDQMQLAVLSACSTDSEGQGTYATADNLGLLFLRDGVPHVVGSRWNVDSAGTAFLMRQFYSSLFSGKSVSESIREAKIEMRMRPEWTHPYFWASFEALGMP